MRSYVSSKQVHSILSRILKPWFITHGWQKRKGFTCAYLHPRDEQSGFWCFWIQCNQWGGKDFGNSFTINLGPQWLPDQSLACSPNGRVLEMLGTSDLQEGLAIETRIVARIPKPSPGSRIYELMKSPGNAGNITRENWAHTFIPHPELWKPGLDHWLRYYAADDVEEWGEFILARLDLLTQNSTPSTS